MDAVFAGLAVLFLISTILTLLERLIRSEGPVDPPGRRETHFRQP